MFILDVYYVPGSGLRGGDHGDEWDVEPMWRNLQLWCAGQTDQLGRHPQYSQEVKLQDTVCMEGA